MKIIKGILVLTLIFILSSGAYAGYSAYQLFNGEQKDLGVKYTEKDYDNAVTAKAGVSVNDKGSLYLGSRFRTEGKIHIEETFSDAEISAIQEYSNNVKGPFHDVQIHFIGDGKVEASGIVTDPRIKVPGPVYVKGSVTNTGPRSFDVRIDTLQVGNYKVPGPIIEIARKEFLGYVNGILSGIDGLEVEKVEISEGKVKFVGDIPEKIYGYDTSVVTE
ncbi:MAG: hypothetical protein RDU25_03300 [Patescibacteria group bacterium]|nr:hypothetical protein [Patescibacteria group bacterium]